LFPKGIPLSLDFYFWRVYTEYKFDRGRKRMKQVISKRTVDALREKAKQEGKTLYCYDENVTGFGVYALKTGKASYFVQYRVNGTPSKRLTIGKHGVFTAEEARARAKVKLGQVADGRDVGQEKRDSGLKLATGTFKEIAERFLKHKDRSNRYWAEVRSILERDAYPAFGAQPIATITRQQIRAQLDKVRERAPSAERKLYAALNPLFKWAVERGTPDHNPMSEMASPMPGGKRERTLKHEELKAFWAASAALNWPFAPLYRLLLLTGQRREEVAGMRWEEIDLEKGIWTLPSKEAFQPQRTKNGKEHVVDLSPQALAILAEAWPASRRGLIFTTTGNTHVSGFSKVKRRLDALMVKELGSELLPWRVHDIRRTVSTLMAEDLGIDEGVIDRIQNHITGISAGLKGVYQRQEYRPKRRAALIAWGAHVEALVSGTPDPSNVISISGRLAG
jgi:integrase